MVAAFKQRRDVIVSGLNTIKGFHCTMPNGAFYAFPDIRETGKSSSDLARYLLDEAHVG